MQAVIMLLHCLNRYSIRSSNTRRPAMLSFGMPHSPLQRLSIGPQQPLHPHHQIGLRRFNDQVKVVVHQAIPMHLPAGLLTGLRQPLQHCNSRS